MIYNIYILYICAIIFAEVAIVIMGNNVEQSELPSLNSDSYGMTFADERFR